MRSATVGTPTRSKKPVDFAGGNQSFGGVLLLREAERLASPITGRMGLLVETVVFDG
jgi:hypothetical protein